MGTAGRKGKRSKRNRRLRRRRIRIIVVGTLWSLITICITIAIVILYGVFFGKDNVVHVNGNKASKTDYETINSEELNNFKKSYQKGGAGDRNGYTVCLDAGHGGSDVGAERSNGKYEKLSLIQISETTRQSLISYDLYCL